MLIEFIQPNISITVRYTLYATHAVDQGPPKVSVFLRVCIDGVLGGTAGGNQGSALTGVQHFDAKGGRWRYSASYTSTKGWIEMAGEAGIDDEQEFLRLDGAQEANQVRAFQTSFGLDLVI